MAEKLFTNVRLGLKIDTLENWGKSSLVLKKGEVAFATVAASEGLGLTDPVVMMKIGDGEHTFSELTFDFYAKASDVLAACKSETALKAFVDGVIADAGIATNEALTALAGRVTTAEGDIDKLEVALDGEGGLKDRMEAVEAKAALVGDEAVATQIQNAIAALNLANTYEAKGEAAKVSTALETYKTSNDAAVLANTNAIAAEEARAKVAEKANADAIALIKDGTTLDSFADVETAVAAAQKAGEDAAAQALVDAKAYADGKDADIAAAKKAGEDAAAAVQGKLDLEVERATAAEAQALKDAKDYTDAEILRMVGEDTVVDQISAAITAENLGQYETKTDAAGKLTEAKKHATDLNTAMDERVQALEAIDHDHENKEVLDGITAEKVAAWDAAEQNAKDYADGLDEAMDARVLALEGKFGEGEGNVESQIATAVAGEAALREAADEALAGRIKAVEDDYLVGADKTELTGKIEALEGVVGDIDSVATAISDAVAAEAEIARKAEKDNADAIAAEVKRATEAEAGLQTQINTIMNNPETDKVIDSIAEFTQYVADHGTIAEGMRTDINKNKEDIAAEAERAAGVEAGLDTRLKVVEAASATHALAADLEALEDVVETKAAQADLEALDGRVEVAEGKVSTLEGEMDAVEGRVEVVEGLIGEGGTVQEQISAAITALKIGDYAKAADLTAAINQHNTDKAALEGEIAKKADDSALAAIAKTGSTDDLVQGEMIIVFDCGGADVE